MLRYDATAARWQALAGGLALRADTAQPLSAAQQAQSRANAGVPNRNYLINPSGEINQAGVGAQSDASYDFDQWLTLTQANPVSVSQLVDAEDGTPFMMRTLQSNAAAQRFGRIQWLEKLLCRELRGQPVTLSARVRISAAATLRYAIVEWTGAADAIAKDVVNDWSSASFAAGGFFTAASTVVVASGAMALGANTLTDLAPLTGTVSSAMNNLAVLLWTDAAQPQNVSLDIGKVKLEKGAVPTPFVAPPFDQSLAACQRYWCKSYDYATAPGTATRIGADGVYVAGAATNNGGVYPRFPVRMRIAPSGGITVYSSASGTAGVLRDAGNAVDLAAIIDLVGERGFRGFTAVGTGSILLLDCHYTASARL
ncbi:hypothetical protein [Rhodopseudomonas sp.]|uniref:hypothetical protein n=1 Tax=Rhodopseudomonas sp. TaxID=1078 RepID=UPI0039C8DED5